MADYHEHVMITGSNADMLSGKMESRPGGRYLSKTILPFSFEEFLDYRNVPHEEESFLSASGNGRIRACAQDDIYEADTQKQLTQILTEIHEQNK